MSFIFCSLIFNLNHSLKYFFFLYRGEFLTLVNILSTFPFLFHSVNFFFPIYLFPTELLLFTRPFSCHTFSLFIVNFSHFPSLCFQLPHSIYFFGLIITRCYYFFFFWGGGVCVPLHDSFHFFSFHVPPLFSLLRPVFRVFFPCFSSSFVCVILFPSFLAPLISLSRRHLSSLLPLLYFRSSFHSRLLLFFSLINIPPPRLI